MDSVPLWLGVLACAGPAAAALLPLPTRARLALAAAALLIAPVVIAADNWNGERFVELRDRPELAAFGLAATVAAVAALAALVLHRPRLLPLLLVAALPVRIPVELAGASANLLLPLYAVLAAGLLAALLRPAELVPSERALSATGRVPGIVLATIIVLYALQAGYADDLSGAVETVGFFLAPFAGLYVLISAAPWDRGLLRLAVIVAAIEGLLVAVVGFGQYLSGELLWNEKVIDGNEAHAYFRVNSLFYDPNIMGRYLAVTMIALAAVVGWGSRRQAGAAGFSFVVLLVALVITFSQTSALALIAGIAVLVLAAWGLLRGAAATLCAAAATAAVVLGFAGGGLTAETTGRTGLVSGGIELAEDRPLAGHGSGTFAVEFEQRFGGGDGIAVESHTEPITIAAEQGVVGLLPYLALLAVVGVGLWLAAGIGRLPAHDPLAATLLAAFVAMVVHSLGYAAFLVDPITWLLLALAVALPARLPAGRRLPSRPELDPEAA
jgi:putative inorganic carbon (hco3(-)) transporter